VFEPWLPGTCIKLGGASSQVPRLAYGYSRHAYQLGYPLLIPSTVALESPFERLRSSGGYIFVVEVPWGARATPRG